MLKYKQVFFFLYFIIAVVIANAQPANIDSLKFIIKSNTENGEKVKAYKALSQAMMFKDFDECQAANTFGARLAEKLNDLGSLSLPVAFISAKRFYRK